MLQNNKIYERKTAFKEPLCQKGSFFSLTFFSIKNPLELSKEPYATVCVVVSKTLHCARGTSKEARTGFTPPNTPLCIS